MSRYARGTSVSSARSKAEIEATLARYGASKFFHGAEEGRAVVGFVMNDRQVRFELPLPRKDEQRFWRTPRGRDRTDPARAASEWEQATRQAWRALALVVKAKLEAVESGIATFEEEFLAHIVMPNNKTVGAWLIPQIADAYETKRMPPMLPAGEA